MRRMMDYQMLMPTGLLLLASISSAQSADKPTVEFALQLQPIQHDIDYDRPSAEDAKKCVIDSEMSGGSTSWVVHSDDGQTLRRFQDTSGDGKVDQWCYFKGGVEIYRDIDGNNNGKADQYRWLGTAGTRWGIDSNEDGRIDTWKVISAEEVTAEVIAAIRERDSQRFTRLLIEKEELQSLGLNEKRIEEIQRKVEQAAADFEEIAQKQKAIKSSSNWVFFGGGRPGVIPTGNDGTTHDVYLYDNVSAVVETGGEHTQLAIGTMVRTGDTWRLLDLPAGLLDGDELGGYFFQASLASRPPQAQDSPDLDENVQKLIADLDAVDRQLPDADQETQSKLNAKRADVLEQLVDAAKTGEEKSVWIKQFADTVGAAVQTGAYPDGLGRLENLIKSIGSDPSNKELVGYVKYRLISADYGRKINDPKADLTKVQDDWLEVLNAYIKEYPKTPESAEAMLQIATASEFSGKEDDAITWYTRITKEYDDATPVAAKAAGAKRRLESVGKVLELQGTSSEGRAWKLASMRGKPVIIYYWASWCEPCKQDFEVLQSLQEKYKNRFTIVGINLDTDEHAFKQSVTSQKLQWTHVREPEGLDGRLANELGVLTLPTMLLLDKSGKVLNRNAHASDLDKELGKIVR